MYIVAGLIEKPDKVNGKPFNTAVVINKKGDLITKHRKLHLFDVDLPGRLTVKESDIFEPGNKITTFETEWGVIGLGICYDMRLKLNYIFLSKNQKIKKIILDFLNKL